MRIALAGDHGGYALKEEIKNFLADQGYIYEDFGCFSGESVDYPDYVLPVARGVLSEAFTRGILFCGTGIGLSIMANKIRGIRAALCTDSFSARAAREHNNSNILVLGGRVLGPEVAKEITQIWLHTPYSGEERHARRLAKLQAFETEHCCPLGVSDKG